MKIVPIVDPKTRFLRFLNNASISGHQDKRTRAEDNYRTYFDYMKYLEVTLLMLEFILAFTAWAYHEAIHTDALVMLQPYIEALIAVTSLALICLKVARNQIRNKNGALMYLIYPKTIFGIRQNFHFYLEIFLYCIFPSSLFRFEAIDRFMLFVEKIDMSVEFVLNDFVIAFVILRCGFYALPRCLIIGAINKKKFRRIAYIYGIEDSFNYLWKYYLSYHTLMISVFVYLSGICLFAVLIKIIERPNPLFDFTSFVKTFYFMYITFASVGYGEIYPVTIPGKLLTILSLIIGFLTTSLFTYSLMNELNFVGNETKTFNLFEKSMIQKELEIDILNFFFYLRRLTKLSFCRQDTTTRLLVKHYLQKFYDSYRRLRSHKLEFKMLEGIIQNNQGEVTKHRLELYFDIFYKEIEKANKNQREIAKMTRRWVIPEFLEE
jgi:hypothetical protein